MKIAQITPEIYPHSAPDRRGYNQLGGDIFALSVNLAKLGHEVSVLSPLYGIIDRTVHPLKKTGRKTWVNVHDTVMEFEIYEGTAGGVTFYFFANSTLFDRRGVYGYGGTDFADNDLRFGAFCQACLNYISTFAPDTQILHSHNWSTALVAVYKSARYPSMPWETVLTIHNLSEQGIFNRFSMEALGLPWDMYTMERLEFYDNINILKGGIVYADAVVALNALHAESFLMHDTGFGLDGVFRRYQHKLTSIPNGIDCKYWNPATDDRLEQRYDFHDLARRKTNKDKFCARYGLDCDKPLFCVISRYVSKEGIDIVLHVLPSLMRNNINLFLYGRGEESHVNKLFDQQKLYQNMRVVADTDPSVFHNILAAADFIIIPYINPSMGKERRLAMRYGAIPLVRGYGNAGEDTTRTSKDDIIRFKHYSIEDLYEVVQNAIKLYYDRNEKDRYITEIMQHDNSWEFTAKEHEALYYSLINPAQTI